MFESVSERKIFARNLYLAAGAHSASIGFALLFCFLVTPFNQFLIILGRCTLYGLVCLQDEPTCMRIESLTCTGDDRPCTGGLQLTSRSEGRHTVSCHSCK